MGDLRAVGPADFFESAGFFPATTRPTHARPNEILENPRETLAARPLPQSGHTVMHHHQVSATEEPFAMKSTSRIAIALAALLLTAGPLAAQAPPEAPASGAPGAAAQDNNAAPTDEGRRIVMQYFKPNDQRGLNMFETPKTPGVEYTGFKLDFGAAFTSQVQALEHSNTATPVIVNGVNTNDSTTPPRTSICTPSSPTASASS
jgi:hypothetical protein